MALSAPTMAPWRDASSYSEDDSFTVSTDTTSESGRSDLGKDSCDDIILEAPSRDITGSIDMIDIVAQKTASVDDWSAAFASVTCPPTPIADREEWRKMLRKHQIYGVCRGPRIQLDSKHSRPSIFKDVVYRSTLESRHAVFLHDLIIPFAYEYMKAKVSNRSYYTIDFTVLDSTQVVHLEIKPKAVGLKEMDRCKALAKVRPGEMVVILYGNVCRGSGYVDDVPTRGSGFRNYRFATGIFGEAWIYTTEHGMRSFARAHWGYTGADAKDIPSTSDWAAMSKAERTMASSTTLGMVVSANLTKDFLIRTQHPAIAHAYKAVEDAEMCRATPENLPPRYRDVIRH